MSSLAKEGYRFHKEVSGPDGEDCLTVIFIAAFLIEFVHVAAFEFEDFFVTLTKFLCL